MFDGVVRPHNLLERPHHLEDGVTSPCAEVVNLQSRLITQDLIQGGHMALGFREG